MDSENITLLTEKETLEAIETAGGFDLEHSTYKALAILVLGMLFAHKETFVEGRDKDYTLPSDGAWAALNKLCSRTPPPATTLERDLFIEAYRFQAAEEEKK